jgi:hypothetical protein
MLPMLDQTLPRVTESGAYARRMLRAALRRGRAERPDLTQRMVGDALGWSPAKIMRIEKGHTRASQTDVEALIRLYGLGDELGRQLLRWQRVGRTAKPLYERYRDLLPKDFEEYLDEEEAAAAVYGFEPLLIPGHLQTRAYALETLHTFGTRDDAVERLLELRELRQRYLTDHRGLEGHFVLTEAAVRLRVGGPDVMVEQLTRLKELGRRANIHLHLVPDSAGLFSRYMRLPFVILEFEDGERLAMLEREIDAQTVRDDSEHVGRVRDAFTAMTAKAVTGPDLDAVLDTAIDRHRAA